MTERIIAPERAEALGALRRARKFRVTRLGRIRFTPVRRLSAAAECPSLLKLCTDR